MTMDATAVAYDAGGLAVKEYFFSPRTVTLPVDAGTYDVMLFNGLMYAPDDVKLDGGIYFRGTESLSTFEAVAGEGSQGRMLARAEGEYIASNSMEILTSAVDRQQIDASRAYYKKYDNGENGLDTPSDFVAAELSMTPAPMSYESQIVVKVVNMSSINGGGASAALYGFVGSAMMATRWPTHFYVTHHLNLNSARITDTAKDSGTIQSPVFVTFGPPLDAPDNVYKVLVKIRMVNGKDFEETFDVTEQILPVIEAIRDNHATGATMQYKLEIPLEVEVDLPKVDPVEGSIGLDEWGPDEIITVPIPKP